MIRLLIGVGFPLFVCWLCLRKPSIEMTGEDEFIHYRAVQLIEETEAWLQEVDQ